MKTNLIKCVAVSTVVIFSACGSESPDGIYVAKWKNEFSVADDTIIIKDNIVTKRTGYQKIRNGKLKPKEWSVQRWRFNDPDSPVIEPGEKEISIGTTTYKLIEP
ncbi:hypothetical protein [Mucilaginibacter myungsuensis]|uniref:Uncharacterized protein n=1 Tax=Mucilaginibacter myungsuensis TaxID=649104 RepID=A0A929KYQ8_9SPHI|nr:hypothetical protein [Mucilaginibacter myungsuensis]MBE9663107.1 hypothetical protein [Mucilaginibacter myungsuensis]MDN3598742.1 hypothetical protein [Mucilaginibacter myungsuensis]